MPAKRKRPSTLVSTADMIKAAGREARAEAMTEFAAHALTAAFHAWREVGNERNADDCERARMLLPGQLP